VITRIRALFDRSHSTRDTSLGYTILIPNDFGPPSLCGQLNTQRLEATATAMTAVIPEQIEALRTALLAHVRTDPQGA